MCIRDRYRIGSRFDHYRNYIEGLISKYPNTKISQDAKKGVQNIDKVAIIVVVNDERYGGMCWSWSSGRARFMQVLGRKDSVLNALKYIFDDVAVTRVDAVSYTHLVFLLSQLHLYLH